MDRYLKKTLITATTTTIDTSLDGAKIISIENTISDDSSNEENVRPKRKKQYKHIFNNDWTKQFAWLKNIKPDSKFGKAFYILCNKTLSGNFFHIKRHENSCVHKRNVKGQKITPSVNFSLSKILQKKDSLQQKERELKMIAFIAEHNLPISIMDHFPAFMKSICPESKLIQNIHCGRTKANLILRDIFRQENIMVLSELMKQNYFSIIIDETTDIGTQKSLVVCVRLVSASSVKDHFLTLMSLENSTAQCITDKVIEFLNSVEVPLQNMIGFAADNASVMMGNISGVQARLREFVPHLFVLGCTCHSFHLCCSAACMQLPRAIEQLARDIYNFFSNSTKRYSELQEFQTFLHIKPNKMLRPSQTRWLSLGLVVKKILINWEALKLYFQHVMLTDKLPSTENILTALRNPVYKLYFLFLNFMLDIVNKLNLNFQSERPRITTLYDNISSQYKMILKFFLKKSVVDSIPLNEINPKNNILCLDINNMYFGAEVEDFLKSNNSLTADDVKSFKHKCLSFYSELCNQIKNRFMFGDSGLKVLNVFNPDVSKSGNVPSLVTVWNNFPKLKDDVNIENLNLEWRSIPDVKDLENIEDLEEFWFSIINKKCSLTQEILYPNLKKVIKYIFALPHSSASAERIFSQLSLIKTRVRNKLLISTCENLLHAKYYINRESSACYNFIPNESILTRNVTYNETDMNNVPDVTIQYVEDDFL